MPAVVANQKDCRVLLGARRFQCIEHQPKVRVKVTDSSIVRQSPGLGHRIGVVPKDLIEPRVPRNCGCRFGEVLHLGHRDVVGVSVGVKEARRHGPRQVRPVVAHCDKEGSRGVGRRRGPLDMPDSRHREQRLSIVFLTIHNLLPSVAESLDQRAAAVAALVHILSKRVIVRNPRPLVVIVDRAAWVIRLARAEDVVALGEEVPWEGRPRRAVPGAGAGVVVERCVPMHSEVVDEVPSLGAIRAPSRHKRVSGR
mmetsp:Transcript_23436/g.61366  ORF Transcript_23436/g.61366 Transcript_23436/m.61366 type:complete len:254 (+) Transcript_23436:935-1696(+)